MPGKLLTELPKSNRGGRTRKYDFTKLYDGRPWLIVRGEDFDCEVASIRQLIYRDVGEMGKSVKSTETTVGEGDDEKEALAFQVVDKREKDSDDEPDADADATPDHMPDQDVKDAADDGGAQAKGRAKAGAKS